MRSLQKTSVEILTKNLQYAKNYSTKISETLG